MHEVHFPCSHHYDPKTMLNNKSKEQSLEVNNSSFSTTRVSMFAELYRQPFENWDH